MIVTLLEESIGKKYYSLNETLKMHPGTIVTAYTLSNGAYVEHGYAIVGCDSVFSISTPPCSITNDFFKFTVVPVGTKIVLEQA